MKKSHRDRNIHSRKWPGRRTLLVVALEGLLLGSLPLVSGSGSDMSQISDLQAYEVPAKHATVRVQPPELKYDALKDLDSMDRMLLFRDIIEKTEARYDLEEGWLAALIMQESLGDPLALNWTDDGGAGLGMFQPGTARDLGMKVYGTSNRTGPDYAHGRELRALVMEYDSDIEKLRKIDQRFDPEISIDKMGAYLSWLNSKYPDMRMAISAYNVGQNGNVHVNSKHVKGVRTYRSEYMEVIAEK